MKHTNLLFSASFAALTACAPAGAQQSSISAAPAPHSASAPLPPQSGVLPSGDGVLSVAVVTDGQHSVNSYFVEGDTGSVVIDAQWNLPDARKALELAGDPRVSAVLITHAHTDHFGGLPVMLADGGELLLSAGTELAMQTDLQGFRANREEQFGPDFPKSFQRADRVLSDGKTVTVDGVRIVPIVLGQNEAWETTVFYIPEHRALFTSDLVNHDTLPFLFQGGLDKWIEDLGTLQQRFPDARTLYPGHGAPGPASELLSEAIDVLNAHRELIAGALEGDGSVDASERAAIKAEILRRYPGIRQTAGFATRDEVLDINIDATLRAWRVASAAQENAE